MNISAEMVRKLREETGGDPDKARDVLRTKGLAAAAKKSGRTASEGMIGTYIHPGSKIGVMVEINCETDFVAKTPEFQSLVKDVAMHIAAASPLYVTKEDVPAEVLDKEKGIYKSQAAAQGKPAQVQEKIAEGKLKQYYADFCLLEQPFVKDSQVTVGQLVHAKVALLKENIVVRRFARFKVGEEVQGAKTDLAPVAVTK